MTNLTEIESAIEQLPSSDVQLLATWLSDYFASQQMHEGDNQNQVEEPVDSVNFLDEKLTPNARSLREGLTYDPNAKPIWKIAAEIAADVPAEEWAKVPTDLARCFDYYQHQDSQVVE